MQHTRSRVNNVSFWVSVFSGGTVADCRYRNGERRHGQSGHTRGETGRHRSPGLRFVRGLRPGRGWLRGIRRPGRLLSIPIRRDGPGRHRTVRRGGAGRVRAIRRRAGRLRAIRRRASVVRAIRRRARVVRAIRRFGGAHQPAVLPAAAGVRRVPVGRGLQRSADLGGLQLAGSHVRLPIGRLRCRPVGRLRCRSVSRLRCRSVGRVQLAVRI